MSIPAREDYYLADGTLCKFKPMPNGEIRTSMTDPSGTKISITKIPFWEIGAGLPWQDAHFHKGVTEHYIVDTGWAGFLFEKGNEPCWQVVQAGGHISFSPLDGHVVLLGPGAILFTAQTGIPIGNPDRQGNDWWPVSEYTARIFASEKERIEATYL
jgi:hypothetical protein